MNLPNQCSPTGASLRTFAEVEARLRSLLIAGLDGDSHAYALFLDGLSTHLRVFLRRRLAAADSDAQDVLQEILLAVHKSRQTYRMDSPLTAWAYAIARNKLMDFYRAQSRRAAFNNPLEFEAEPVACCATESANASRDVSDLLDGLPDRYRLPILHTKLHGYSVTETAKLTGLSTSAVKIGIHRGLKKLMSNISAAE
jgi:RNA polymerase sigma-70 factor, ECF subfamily